MPDVTKTVPMLSVPAAITWAIFNGLSARKPSKERQGLHHRLSGKLRNLARPKTVPRTLLDGRGWETADGGQPWVVRWDEDDDKSALYLLPARLRNRRTDEARRLRIAWTEAEAAKPMTPHDAVKIAGSGWQTIAGHAFLEWALLTLTPDEAEYVETGLDRTLKLAHESEDAAPEKRVALPTKFLEALPDAQAALAWWKDASKSPPEFRAHAGGQYDADGEHVAPVDPPLEDDRAAVADLFAAPRPSVTP